MNGTLAEYFKLWYAVIEPAESEVIAITAYNDFSYKSSSLYTMSFEDEILDLTNSNRIDSLGLSLFREGTQRVCVYTDICTLNCTVYVSRTSSDKGEGSYLIEVKNITASKRKKR